MTNLDEHLNQYLREQIALEEHLFKGIQDQIAGIDGIEFADAKDLLIKTNQVLEKHFTALNEILDVLDRGTADSVTKAAASNGGGFADPLQQRIEKIRISRIVRDDYSALSLIAISNTLLHATALALRSQEVAKLALQHLENLTPLVLRMGELVPDVVTRELRFHSPTIDLSVAKLALQNAQMAWKKAA